MNGFYKYIEGLEDFGYKFHDPRYEDFSGQIVPRDRKLIQNPIVEKKLKEVLEKSTPFKYNILIFENPASIIPRITFVKNILNEKKLSTHDAITFIKTSSTGDPLTPWMILHCFGHSLCEENDCSGIKTFLEELTLELGSFAKTLSIFKFRSASKSNLQNMDEFVYEIIAEYLWHGFIRNNTNDPIIKEEIKTLEKTILSMLQKSVGKILIDEV